MSQDSHIFSFPTLIAHRGASLVAPENTLLALQQAAELGACCVECDIQLAITGEAVIFHDDTLDRTTNGTGVVEKKSYEELLALDAGRWFDESYANTRIPLLSEWLQCAAQHRLRLNLEIKATDQVDRVVEVTLNEIAQHWLPELPPLLISSTATDILQACYDRAPQLSLALISDTWLPDWQAVLTRCHCLSWHVNQWLLTEDRIQAVNAAGFHLLAYTVNDKADAAALLQQGVTAVFSDDVGLLS